MKQLITNHSVLRYYGVSKEVTQQCDASQSGLGAALLQEGQPVAFTSRALTATEKNYAQIEKEHLAIVHAWERFNQYLFGQEVTVETDHKPLEATELPAKSCLQERPRDVNSRHLEQGVPTRTRPYLTELIRVYLISRRSRHDQASCRDKRAS